MWSFFDIIYLLQLPVRCTRLSLKLIAANCRLRLLFFYSNATASGQSGASSLVEAMKRVSKCHLKAKILNFRKTGQIPINNWLLIYCEQRFPVTKIVFQMSMTQDSVGAEPRIDPIRKQNCEVFRSRQKNSENVSGIDNGGCRPKVSDVP